MPHGRDAASPARADGMVGPNKMWMAQALAALPCQLAPGRLRGGLPATRSMAKRAQPKLHPPSPVFTASTALTFEIALAEDAEALTCSRRLLL
eukprot:154011-Pleurochrysis_carterae.AAC.1